MANTDASKASAERLEGSTPSPRTALQNLHDWNTSIFADAKAKAEREFDELLERQAAARAKRMPPMPPREDTLW
jgi:streptomycin 6-kinase